MAFASIFRGPIWWDGKSSTLGKSSSSLFWGRSGSNFAQEVLIPWLNMEFRPEVSLNKAEEDLDLIANMEVIMALDYVWLPALGNLSETCSISPSSHHRRNSFLLQTRLNWFSAPEMPSQKCYNVSILFWAYFCFSTLNWSSFVWEKSIPRYLFLKVSVVLIKAKSIKIE